MKEGDGSTNHDTIGMYQYDCDSSLTVLCQKANGDSMDWVIRVKLQHSDDHVLYYNVDIPPGAAGIIHKNLEWSTPVSLVPKIQVAYPNVTSKQSHTAWTHMSETLWTQDQYQLPSVETLLKEYSEDVDVFDILVVDGVDQLCWGMKKIVGPLKGKVVEIGIDATCGYIIQHIKGQH